jgi:transcription antitermination protein NusB
MLNRRHFRVKIMQTIYAMQQHQSDQLDKEERFLMQSIEVSQDLYLLTLSLFLEIQKKENEFLNIKSKMHLATKAEKNPNLKFVSNAFFSILKNQQDWQEKLEERKINNWQLNDDCVLIILDAIKKSELYQNYMQNDKNNFVEDLQFIHALFTEIIAPNEKYYDYIEDHKLTWLDDLPVINTLLAKQIKNIKTEKDTLQFPKVLNNEDDKEFVQKLFRKTVLNDKELAKEFEDKTPNWDKDRIAEIDTIILKMAICELKYFSSIPVKVSINEYLEIAKEYSTPKSSIFINGILDNLVKENAQTDKFKKSGRGLL